MDHPWVFSNPQQFQQKVTALQRGGASSLQVISDFDKTITKAFINGKKFQSSYALLRDEKYLTPDYPQKAQALFNIYHPIEIAANIPQAQKNQKMIEWWSKHHNLMVECGLSRADIRDLVKKGKIVPREGTFQFLDLLSSHHIPLLIFSSGLGDLITEFLIQSRKLTSNLHIISNFFTFDQKGKAVAPYPHLIHVFNKNEVEIKNTPYYQEIKSRKNVILLGDSLGDVGMTEGLDHNLILRIGFLNENMEQNISRYLKYFDVVITHDGTMDYVNSLLIKIFRK